MVKGLLFGLALCMSASLNAINKAEIIGGIVIGVSGVYCYNIIKKKINKNIKSVKKTLNTIKVPAVAIGSFALGWNAKSGNLPILVSYVGSGLKKTITSMAEGIGSVIINIVRRAT